MVITFRIKIIENHLAELITYLPTFYKPIIKHYDRFLPHIVSAVVVAGILISGAGMYKARDLLALHSATPIASVSTTAIKNTTASQIEKPTVHPAIVTQTAQNQTEQDND